MTDDTAAAAPAAQHSALWALPQPLLVLGAMLAVAIGAASGWAGTDTLTTALLLAPVPVLMLAERLAPHRHDWMLDRRDFLEDVFWVASGLLIWVPIYDDYYDTPISDAFSALREASGLPLQLAGDSVAGLMIAAFCAVLVSEFIYYWLHRLQHRTLLFWRIHGTHHHITRMSVARAQRTHPLEFLALNLGPAVTLALLGASDDVAALVIVFLVWNGHLTHTNLPLKSGFWGWLFTTPQWHRLHHSLDRAESDTNFGCSVILMDRLFGTFSDRPEPERIGNGSGRALSIWSQLILPFRSNESLKTL